ncbi:UPF0481 protein At3g47200-like [Dioscorea cayenensis subsp. rotundata]|uniref:UPF0481 protein At3g47200-like n=1 Tax=Dioscorea cayennensis subsp. rotundata TaxID=55577 RepID=A0AB40CKV7_DIOCR|nr:UPF0481 protein At3g47200-like [Dioscorea cayenensis subsp. rotundata]
MDEMTPLKPNDMSGGDRGLPDKHPIDIDRDCDVAWIKEFRSSVNKQRGRRPGKKPCTIFKIQDSICLRNEDAYRPLLISIGPYYHKRLPTSNNYVITLENQKWLCLRHLLFRNRIRGNATELLEKCLIAMKKLGDEIRSCYSHELDNLTDDHSLAQVMLLDGCFILQLILLFGEKTPANKKDDKEDEVGEAREMLSPLHTEEEEFQLPPLGMLWTWNILRFDLLKLENQIPFFVLTTLFDLFIAPSDERPNLVDLVFKLFSDIHPSDPKSQDSLELLEATKVHHLLHLFHSTLVPSKINSPLSIKRAIKAPKWIPNATELRQAGVKFVKKENARNFLDISYNNGTMEIPELSLHDHTDTLFRNMIAFEQCYPGVENQVSLYAIFMDCIIDTPNDAHLLHLKGILSNRLSTDEAAAELFNKLSYQIYYVLQGEYLHEFCDAVNSFHKKKRNRWRAKLMRDYFSNPWAIISLITAVVFLLLTLEQSSFNVLSYFHQT